MRKDYTIIYIALQIIPNSGGITLISGDYKCNNLSSKDNRSYIFTSVNNDYFTDEWIIDLLETSLIDWCNNFNCI